jgi:transcriptional regulator with XRE-family HTH domain
MMATRPLSPGPAGERFGALLRQLRHAAGLDQQALSAKLTELGHPIPVGSISRMETGARRADVSAYRPRATPATR